MSDTKHTINIDLWVSDDQENKVIDETNRISIPLQVEITGTFVLYRLLSQLWIKTATLFGENEYLVRLLMDQSVLADTDEIADYTPPRLIWRPVLTHKRKS